MEVCCARMVWRVAVVVCLVAGGAQVDATAARTTLTETTMEEIWAMNEKGPYVGVVVPNAFEMNPLITSSDYFRADKKTPYIDYGGKRFRFGTVAEKKVIVVMTGLSMLNAGITTQLLLTLFDIEGVVHFGVAGNANPNIQIGDVVVPRYWAHTGLVYWQRYRDGTNDMLAFESSGDFTRKYGYLLMFSDYNNVTELAGDDVVGNYLNRVWYQPEEVFTSDGGADPEHRRHVFWVEVTRRYFSLAGKLKNLKLERCVNSTTCLPREPVVSRVSRGCSAAVFVDNAAYRDFLRCTFGVTPIDMETAAVALVARERGAPFVALRAISDLAGGGSSVSNEATVFSGLAAANAARAAAVFISML